MLRTLSSRLVAAFALLVVVVLLLAGSTFLLLLRGFEREIAIERLKDNAAIIAIQVQRLGRNPAANEAIPEYISEQATALDARVLLVDREGRVLVDSEGKLEGESLGIHRDALAITQTRPVVGTLHTEGGDLLFVALPGREIALPPMRERLRGILGLPSDASPPATAVAVAITAPSWWGLWAQLSPRLLRAGLLALVIAVPLALLLAASITGPLRRLTRATEEVARGNYDHEVPIQGSEEVAHLAEGFNQMVRQVERGRQTERDLLANVSHELKTPLTSVRGFAQAIREGTAQGEASVRQAADVIWEEAQRMDRLVGDLTDLARLEAGETSLEREPVDVASLLQRCATAMEFGFRESGVSLSVATDHVPALLADGGRLEQVVRNLLDNARCHTPAGGKVELRARQLGHDIAIQVADTGSGIPPEALPRIFERFYRVEPSRSPHSAGLGLAIAKEIVQAHGGRIEVASRLGEGSTFTVILPAGRTSETGRA